VHLLHIIHITYTFSNKTLKGISGFWNEAGKESLNLGFLFKIINGELDFHKKRCK